jgi:hypothetical protein
MESLGTPMRVTGGSVFLRTHRLSAGVCCVEVSQERRDGLRMGSARSCRRNDSGGVNGWSKAGKWMADDHAEIGHVGIDQLQFPLPSHSPPLHGVPAGAFVQPVWLTVGSQTWHSAIGFGSPLL